MSRCDHAAGWCGLSHGEECRAFRATWGPPEPDDSADIDREPMSAQDANREADRAEARREHDWRRA